MLADYNAVLHVFPACPFVCMYDHLCGWECVCVGIYAGTGVSYTRADAGEVGRVLDYFFCTCRPMFRERRRQEGAISGELCQQDILENPTSVASGRESYPEWL